MPLLDTLIAPTSQISPTIARILARLCAVDSASPYVVCCKAASEQTSRVRIEKVLTAALDSYKPWHEI